MGCRFWGASPATVVFSSELHEYYGTFIFHASDLDALKGRENIKVTVNVNQPVPVAARSKAWVCGRSPAEIVGSNPTGGMDVCFLWMLCNAR